MKQINYKKKRQLKNVGTATALTITLVTSNVSTLSYAMETEKDINEGVAIEELSNQYNNTKSTSNNFDLSKWDFKIFSSTIVLDKYKGDSTDIVIPGEIFVNKELISLASNYNPNSSYAEGNRQVKIGTICGSNSNDCFVDNRSKITNLKFKEVNGKKVLFPDNTSKDLFLNLKSLKKIDLSGADLSNLTGAVPNLFGGCTLLEDINLNGTVMPNITEMSNIFSGCTSLKKVDLTNLQTSSKLTTVSSMFAGLSNLEEVRLNGFNVSNVNNMYHMFKDCTSLTNIDLSGLDTSKVTNMTGMFIGCTNLKDITFGGQFATNSATLMNNMFKDCNSLQDLDLSSFDTSNVKNMSYMFSDSGLKNIIFGDTFNTSLVDNMSGMFRNTKSLESIDLSKFNTSSVKNMSYMFSGSGLKDLDLSNFDTSSVTNTKAMFALLDNINVLDLSSFNLDNDTNMEHMFANNINVDYINGAITPNTSATPKEFLVISTDDKLTNYDYDADACLPVGPTFNANDGQFEDGSTTKELKINVIASADENYINQLIQDKVDSVEQPARDGYRFVCWDVKNTKSNDNLIDKLNKTYDARWEVIPGEDFDSDMGVVEEPGEVLDGTANDDMMVGIPANPENDGNPSDDFDDSMGVVQDAEEVLDGTSNDNMMVTPEVDNSNGNTSTDNGNINNDNNTNGDSTVGGNTEDNTDSENLKAGDSSIWASATTMAVSLVGLIGIRRKKNN